MLQTKPRSIVFRFSSFFCFGKPLLYHIARVLNADSATALLPGSPKAERTVPFAMTRQKLNPGLHKPPPYFDGKYGYETLNFDDIALGTRNAPESLGAGYGQVKPEPEPERSPTKTSLKRGSRVVRQMSISSMPGTPRRLKRSSIRYQCCF
jgi:hypothetical protein